MRIARILRRSTSPDDPVRTAKPRRLAPPPERIARWIPALLAVLAYANTLANRFAYDDEWIVQRNTPLHRLRDLATLVSHPYWPVGGRDLGLWRPLSSAAWSLQWAAADGAPWLFHASNVLLHAAVCTLVYVLLRRFASATAALVGAVIFALHPVHTEAVANVVGQAELWSSLCVIGAVIVYHDRGPDGISVRRAVAVAALYLGGMLAKENAIVLPALLVLVDAARFGTRRASWRAWPPTLLRAQAYLLVVASAYLLVRFEVLGSIGGTNANPALTFLRGDERLLNAFRAWTEYARLLVFPSRLLADYGPAIVLPVPTLTPMATLGLGLLLVCSAVTVLTPWHPRPGVAAGWFLITILPTSNLLFPAGVLVAERTLYLPSVMVAVAVAALVDELSSSATDAAERRRRMRLVGAAAVVACVAMTARVVLRNRTWHDTNTVMTTLLRDAPESYHAQWATAANMNVEGRDREAELHWELAYRIWPNDARMLGEYASIELVNQRPEHSLQLLRRAEAIMPDAPMNIIPRAMTYGRLGMRDSLEAALDEGFRLIGPEPVLFELTARLAMDSGRPGRAVGAWRAALRRSNGGSREQWQLYAFSLVEAGYPDLAREASAFAADRPVQDSTALRQATIRLERAFGTVADRTRLLQNTAPPPPNGPTPSRTGQR